MKIVAKIIEMGPVMSGTSDNGNNWEKQTVVVETLGLEPEKLAIEFMGEHKTKKTKVLSVGDHVDVVFAIKCREYMGKWYTRLDGQNIFPLRPLTDGELPPQPAATSSEDE